MFTSQQLPSIIEMIRNQGRNGDTMLAHINPQEAEMLRQMGGSGTINPYTGLPEFFFGGLGGIISPLLFATQATKPQMKSPKGISRILMSNPEIVKEAIERIGQKQNTLPKTQQTQQTPKTQPQNPDFMKELVQKLKENNISPFKRKNQDSESDNENGIFNNLFGPIPSFVGKNVAKNALSNPMVTGIVPSIHSLFPSMGSGLNGYAISGRWEE